MKCPKCSRENSGDGNFCDQCGAILSFACPSCNKEISEDSKFCTFCRYEIESTTDAQPPEDKQELKEIPQPADTGESRHCRSCGHRWIGRTVGCPVCGAPVTVEDINKTDTQMLYHLISLSALIQTELGRIIGQGTDKLKKAIQ